VHIGWRFLLLLLLASSARGDKSAVPDFPYARPYFEAVGDRDAIPSGVVTAIARTPDGIMWIGTQTGLLRYDGYRFKQYQYDSASSNSIAGNFVSVVFASSNGLVYVGTSNDGLSVFDPATERFTNHRHDPKQSDSLAEDGITAIAESTQGILVGGNSGLNLLRADSSRFVRLTLPAVAQRPGLTRVRSLLVDRSGLLWVGSWDGLLRANGNQIEAVGGASAAPDSLAGQTVNAIFERADGTLLIGTRQHGLAHVSREGAVLRRPLGEAGGELAGTRIQSIVHPPGADLWVATTVGIYLLDPQTLALKQHWVKQTGVLGSLAFDTIGSMLLDDSGLLFIGTWGGGLQRTQASNRAFKTIRLDADGDQGLSHADVHAVLELGDGTIWVGTGGNGIDVLDPVRGRINGFRPNPQDPNALGDGIVVALKQAPDGSIYVGTQSGGLFKTDQTGSRFERIGDAGSITDLLVAADGVLWVGGTSGVTRLDPKTQRLSVVPGPDGQPVLGQILPMVQDAASRIFVGSKDGLAVREPGSERFLMIRHDPARADSLVHNAVYGLLVDRAGALWVATGRGVGRMRAWAGADTAFDHVSAELGAPGRDIGANLLEDQAGRIWTDSVVIDLANKAIHQLTRADGVDVGTTWFGTHLRTRSGKFLGGGTEGLLVIDPEAYSPWQYAPQVVATELRINGQAAALALLADGLKLDPAQRSFSIEVAALDYSAPEHNVYAWKLDGFDAEWIQSGAGQRQLAYSNLWPGEYALQVRGSNRDGVMSARELKLKITVLPAFWQTPWFALMVILAALGLVALSLRWRTRHLQQRSERLNALVDARTAELKSSNAQLTDSNHALAQAKERLLETQDRLVQQEKMASLGQLIAGVAHEVNTPLGVAITAGTFLRDRTTEFRGQFNSGSLKKSELERYVSDAQSATALVSDNLLRAANLVSQFKQVSIHQSENDRCRLALDDLLGSLLPELIGLLEGRPVELVFLGAPETALDTHTGAIREVLHRLIDNALDHAFLPEQHGVVHLRARELLGEDGATEVEIALSDNGIGMSTQTIAQAFEPFFTTRRNRGGLGLGLHIAFNLVSSRLGGSIRVESKEGQGSTFFVRFPAQQARTKSA